MPYIPMGNRPRLDAPIRELVKNICQVHRDGEVNYIISRLLDTLYGQRYQEMNSALGVLEAVKQEYYRRVVAPHEDEALAKSGDVYGQD